MKDLFNKTFFHFLFGFIIVLFVSFVLILATSAYDSHIKGARNRAAIEDAE